MANNSKGDARGDMCAATPPLAPLQALLSMAMTEGIGYARGKTDEGMKLQFIGIRRASVHARAIS